jgi:hypothetical protein
MLSGDKPQEWPNGSFVAGGTQKKKKWRGQIIGWEKENRSWKYRVQWTNHSPSLELPRSLKLLPTDEYTASAGNNGVVGVPGGQLQNHRQFFQQRVVSCHNYSSNT